MWELDHKEGWALKNWCFQAVLLKQTLESPFNSKEIKPDNPERNQPWIFTGRTDIEAEASILWPLDVKRRLTRKYPDAGKDWGQEGKGVKEDEMVGWCHLLIGHEFEQAPGEAEGQGSLMCCRTWGCKESAKTWRWSDNNNNSWFTILYYFLIHRKVNQLHIHTSTHFLRFFSHIGHSGFLIFTKGFWWVIGVKNQ